MDTAIVPRGSDSLMWRRRRSVASDVESRKDAVTTGVILARLDSVVDRLEGVYDQLAPLLKDAQRPTDTERGESHP